MISVRVRLNSVTKDCSDTDIIPSHCIVEISSPDLRPFLQAFDRLVGYLTQNCEQGGCGWPSTALHLFGFGQGASAALEGVLNWSRSGTEADAKIQEINENQKFLRVAERQFGSVVSICGQLLSVSSSSCLVHSSGRIFAHCTM